MGSIDIIMAIVSIITTIVGGFFSFKTLKDTREKYYKDFMQNRKKKRK